MILKNLTPHVISVKTDGRISVLEPDGNAVRVKSRLGKVIVVEDGITIHGPARITGLQHLPDPQPGTLLVVSQITAAAVAQLHPERDDIVYPATSKFHGAERDTKGVKAVSRFIRAT